MSINTCKLSGVALTKPVIDKVNGFVYQKEEIEKHLIKTGQCPVTGREMKLEDLLDLKHNEDLSLKTATNGSSLNSHVDTVPNILNKINSEYENIVIYNFHLRKELEDLDKESSHLLYQHEAANLVICRLLKEKEEYTQKLNQFRNQIKEINYNQKKQIGEEQEFAYMGITDDLAKKIFDNSLTLAKGRKNRKLPEDFFDKEKLSNFKNTSNFALDNFNYSNENSNFKRGEHSLNSSAYTGLDIHPLNNNLLLASTVNADLYINYYDDKDEQISAILQVGKVNSKRINFVKFQKEDNKIAFLSTSADNTASYFCSNDLNLASLNAKYLVKNVKIQEAYKITNHTSPIVGGDFHPSLNDYCIVASKDGYWSFHNSNKGICLTKQGNEDKKEYHCVEFHPDGNYYFDLIEKKFF